MATTKLNGDECTMEDYSQAGHTGIARHRVQLRLQGVDIEHGNRGMEVTLDNIHEF